MCYQVHLCAPQIHSLSLFIIFQFSLPFSLVSPINELIRYVPVLWGVITPILQLIVSGLLLPLPVWVIIGHAREIGRLYLPYCLSWFRRPDRHGLLLLPSRTSLDHLLAWSGLPRVLAWPNPLHLPDCPVPAHLPNWLGPVRMTVWSGLALLPAHPGLTLLPTWPGLPCLFTCWEHGYSYSFGLMFFSCAFGTLWISWVISF